jgi:hypothetical protein
MRVKQVKYRRTFNLGDSETETIELTASVDEDENDTQVLSQLHEQVVGAKTSLSKIREAKRELTKISLDIGQIETQIQAYKHQIAESEIKIQEGKEPHIAEFENRNIETHKKNIEEEKLKKKDKKEQLARAKENLDNIRKEFEEGVIYVN